MGLVKLYRATGNNKYLDLAKFFLDIRGPKGEEYNQAHSRVVDQTMAVGHSVRATYMYSGMADIAAIEKDKKYLDAITKIWEDIVYTKMYLTGGIGASGGNEGFAGHYNLPNMSAYCETCASIGNIFTNERLFLLHGESKYIDILEKTLYNSMLSGVSLSADRFFYPNPLESNGQHQRSAWFGCACCPSNVARFVPAIPGYVYAVAPNQLFVNLFISNDATVELPGNTVNVSQVADFPWDGKVGISVNPEKNAKFEIRIRIPGWALDEAIPGGLYKFLEKQDLPVSISVNGDPAKYYIESGYAVISRKWKKGDKLAVDFPMTVRRVTADSRVADDAGKIAFQRGPLIFCAEWPDNDNGDVLSLIVDKNAPVTTGFEKSVLNGTQIIRTTGSQTQKLLDGSVEVLPEDTVTFIPYALWNNRGPGQMMVWIPTSSESAKPLPAPTIAHRSKIRASTVTKALSSLNDQQEPANSNDHSVAYYHWWPAKDKWEWLEYNFERPEKISKTKIYWYDDRPDGGCSVPDGWEILYLNGNIWQPVKNTTPYSVTRNAWDSVEFNPVTAKALKIKVKLNREYSAGIYEWTVE
jgi:DUF1680 family protein